MTRATASGIGCRQAIERGHRCPRRGRDRLGAHRRRAAGRPCWPAVDRGRLATLDAADADFFRRYDELIAARSRRIPLQHLTGTAAFGPLELHVGPGVFIPRPETEALLEWASPNACRDAAGDRRPVHRFRRAGHRAGRTAGRAPASSRSTTTPTALDYARRNAAGTAVELVRGRRHRRPACCPSWTGTVDLVVCQPALHPRRGRAGTRSGRA